MRLTQLLRQAPWAVVALVVLAVLLAVLPLVLLPERLSAAPAILTSVGSIVLLVFALFSLVRDTYSAWQMVAALAIVLVLLGAALLVWRQVELARPLTVTDAVRLKGAESMTHGSTATITLQAPAPRDRLLITFEATDLALGSPCAPSSSVWITDGGEVGQEARIGERTVVELDDADLSIRLNARMNTDTNCELDLRVREAVLDDA